MRSCFLDLSLDLSPSGVLQPELDQFRVPDEDGFMERLEDEVNKIKAFKRELPLSFILLTDAIDRLREGARKQGGRQKDGKFDELVRTNLENDHFEMKKWMSSAQLWSLRYGGNDDDQNREWQLCKYKGEGWPFPSSKESIRLSPREEDADSPTALSLMTPGLKTPAIVEPGSRSDEAGLVHYTRIGLTTQPQNKFPFQTSKKRRRCWSPELHGRFLEALEKLGGSQVATPKQIREVMQVDSLTNDEVKSHLQKYRLHVQKLLTSSRMTTPSSSNDVAMDQVWLELGNSKMDLLHSSSSPVSPLQLGRSRKCNSVSVDDLNNANDDNHDNSQGHSRHIN